MQNNPHNPPSKPGEWSLAEIITALSRPIPPVMMKERSVKGKKIVYLPWAIAVEILNKYAPGWSWEITKVEISDRRLFIVGSLSIPTADGVITRQATGAEDLFKLDPQTGEVKPVPFGDPSSNAESMALRRAAEKFGLGLYLKK